jgi:hypothetical protein
VSARPADRRHGFSLHRRILQPVAAAWPAVAGAGIIRLSSSPPQPEHDHGLLLPQAHLFIAAGLAVVDRPGGRCGAGCRNAALAGAGHTRRRLGCVVQTQARPVSGFNAIAVSGSIDVVVRQTGREAAEVKADDNLLPLIETVVEAGSEGRTLKVRWKSGESVHTKADAVVTVDVKELSAIATAGSGDVKVESLKTPKFSLSISGSSDAKLDGLAADELSVRISGSGDVKAAGSAQRLEIKISGSGDVDAQALQSDDVAIAIAGSGDAAVVANRKLAISIAGSGDVVYSGAAAVSQSVAGSGSVRKK